MQKNEVTAIAIGHFDGMHKGHKELIKKLGKNGALIIIESNKANITPSTRREEYSSVPCFYYDLSTIKELRGDEFIKKIISEYPKLEKIVVGYDFKFGKDRAWDKYDLKRLFNGKVEVVKEFSFDNLGVHSSAIRRFLKDGDIYRANRLLGREYSVEGKVIKGQGIGSKDVFPTLNLEISPYLIPKDGVYATRTKIDDETFASVTFIGKRLSADNKFAIETHLIDKNLEKAPVKLRVCFIERIRNNQKFDDLNELKLQIKKDISLAKTVSNACYLSLEDNYTHCRRIF